MGQQVNPLRIIAETQFGVDGGSANLVANGIYSVDDIVRPILSDAAPSGDPRIFYSYGERKSRLRWRKVNRDGWIGPKRKASGDKDTVIQIRFARPKRFNRLNFELLRVPQRWTVKYYDHTRKRMVVLTDDLGRKVDGNLSGFKNNVLTPRHEKNNSHKWRNFRYDLPLIKTNLIELHLNREIKNPPIENLNEFFGLPPDTVYALGVRNLRIKLHLNDDDDDDDDDGTPTPIGTTERPVITRYTSINAHDGDSNSYWECAPQGGANSVVPFYMDMRATDGSATVFDSLKLVPMWTGPNMSIYWSNDDVFTPWQISPNLQSFTRIGNADFIEDTGLTVDTADDAWLISNDYMKVDLTKGFSVGLLYTPTDTNTAGDRYLWNFERPGLALSLKFDPSSNAAGTMTGNFKVFKSVNGVEDVSPLFSSASQTLNKDTQYGVVVGYTYDNLDTTSEIGWHLAFSVQPASDVTVVNEKSTTEVLTGFFPEDMVIGNYLSDSALSAPMRGSITKLWVRMDAWNDGASNSYLKGPDTFVKGGGDKTQRVNGFYNAVLIAKLGKDTVARIGPGAGYYRNKEWNPVPIDYGLTTNTYRIPVVLAKFLKLEFTSLIPRVYLTEEPVLPVTTFPKEVVNYYRGISRTGQRGPHTLNVGRQLFEVASRVQNPGDPRIMADLRSTLETGGVQGVPPSIYHDDQSSTDFSLSPDSFDGSNKYRELEFATTHMRFHRKGRHQYETNYVEVEHRAFFVGIKELQVYRTDHTVQFDSREYNETYDDDLFIASSNSWINVGGALSAQSSGAQIVSKEFQSFSNFEYVQMAVLDSGWESGLTDAQINLADVTHLVDPQGNSFDINHNTATTHFDVVTGQYQGARGGNVLEVSRISGSTVDYGLWTDTGTYTPTLTEDGGRTSAAIRLQLPLTNKGSYELRLYANGDVVASKPINIPIKSWVECEVAYIANTGDADFRAAIVQTNSSVDEPVVVDMMGVWQNPVRWEITNGQSINATPSWIDIASLGNPDFISQDMPRTPGATASGDLRDNPPQSFPIDEQYQTGSQTNADNYNWNPILWPLNNPKAYFRFPTANHFLRVRAIALRTGAVVSGWTIVPWYIESSMVMRAPIDYNPPWGVSDQEDLLDTSRKPIFQTWNHFFPQRFSTNFYGIY